MNKQIILWICRLLAAAIMVQTLYFKFSGHPDSVYIFSKMGMEPYGRILTGVSELIASLLILIPRTTIYGALMGIGVMIGAIFAHIFILGIEINGDGGKLFMLAMITFISCVVMVILLKNKFPSLIVRS